MKKPIIIVVVLIIIGAVAWSLNRGSMSGSSYGDSSDTASQTGPVPISPTSMTEVSKGVTQYRNEELGLGVKYPTAWAVESTPTGVLFNIPTKNEKKNTVEKLQISGDIMSGKCAFPQVSKIDEKSTITVKDVPFSMIAISNAVQGRQYFNRMYSTPKGSVCYMFNFSSIVSNPASKGFSASETADVVATNKELVSAADTAFKALINSFEFVSTPDGDNEALHPVTK